MHGAGPLARAAPRHRAARLARHPGGVDLHLHDRVRGLRRAGDHRLGQSHLHLHDLPLSAAQSAGGAAALRARGRALDHRDGDRRRDELVVRPHAGALAPLRRRHRQAYRPQIVKLGRRVYAAWLFIGTYLLLSKTAADPAADLELAAAVLPAAVGARALATVSLNHYCIAALGDWCSTARHQHLHPGRADADASRSPSASRSPGSCCARGCRGRGLFDFIAFLPHAVPSIVFGVGALLLALFVLQRALPIYGTIWILLIVFTIARISYGTRMTNSGLIQIHAELEESAQMSGATAWRRVPPRDRAAARRRRCSTRGCGSRCSCSAN